MDKKGKLLTIGQFAALHGINKKTLMWYDEIGLFHPSAIDPENGYRYYSINQLEKMLLINRLKDYCFSLEEIKLILDSEEQIDEVLFTALNKKKKEIAVKVQKFEDTMHQIDSDISNLRNGKSIMSYMESIDVRLVEIPMMYLLSIRKNVLEHEFSEEYGTCFGQLFRKMEEKKLTAAAPPMVLFHGDEYTPFGLDTEFAIPIKEYATGTRDFCPGLCLKSGEHRALYPSVRRQRPKGAWDCWQEKGPP